jgi:subtilase family serine protease
VESNNGGKADKHMVRIYLSTNSVLDNTDTEIGSNDVNHVAKGEFKTTHVKIEIPSNAGTGSAYLILKIDADNSITESNEANNTIAKSITVTS